jgi:hypothetical protein
MEELPAWMQVARRFLFLSPEEELPEYIDAGA